MFFKNGIDNKSILVISREYPLSSVFHTIISSFDSLKQASIDYSNLRIKDFFFKLNTLPKSLNKFQRLIIKEGDVYGKKRKEPYET
jgi:hypothetical protein